jgi:flavodoxin
MDYLVVYTSNTGNTEKVALKIFETLPGKSKDIIKVEDYKGEEADLYFVGFWNDRGTCGSGIMDFLSSLHGKRVALFGTCGMTGSDEYYKEVENRVSVFLSDDNEYLGGFLCGGRLMPQVLEKYKQMQAINDTPQIRSMIGAYEQGMLHPDKQDFEAAKRFVEKILSKHQKKEN